MKKFVVNCKCCVYNLEKNLNINNIIQNMGKEKGKLFLKIEEISGGRVHTNTWKNSKYFNSHRYLSQSEESKRM